jgi:3-phenylpropionate/trans-cinnamate dioxygenase ferredoxin component
VSAVRVCSASDVPVGGSLRVEVAGREIAVVNLGPEGFRAVDAVCSHAREYLTEGEVDVDEQTIECPKHGSTFDVNTGMPRSLPATAPVDTFVVTTENDDILIEVKNGE